MKLELIFMAWQSLWANRSRALLSSLGIIIGVFVVVLVITVGDMAKGEIDKQFRTINVTSLMVAPQDDTNTKTRMEFEDVEKVLKKAVFINRGSSMLLSGGAVSYGKESENFDILGVPINYFDISNLEFEAGRNFTEEDLNRRAKIGIIGDGLRKEIFGIPSNEVVGKEVSVGGKRISIVGVLKNSGAAGFIQTDDALYVPHTTADSYLLGESARKFLMFTGRDTQTLPLAQEELENLLREIHRIEPGKQDDFKVIDMGTIVSSFSKISVILSALLTAVASIILLVSGIGIMNVMFVTVAERTKEIGILKAIGAQKKDILFQFLVESVSICLVGSLIGIGLGVSVILSLEKFGAQISSFGLLLAFSFSVLVGIFFGIYPALKAARLDPVEALRSE